jgi:beta-lactamase class A
MTQRNTASSELEQGRKLAAIALGSFIAGGVAGGLIYFLAESAQPSSLVTGLRTSDIPSAHSTYQYIDPLIAVKNEGDNAAYETIKNQVSAYITSQKDKGLITSSVFFRDMDASAGFSINPTEHYTPASLNKIPVMMAYFKVAETDPGILKDRILYTGEIDSNSVEEIRSVVTLAPSKRYSVSELIERMIRYSDNNAANLLQQHLKDTGHDGAYAAVFDALGVDSNAYLKYSDTVTAEEYSFFLRSLYNATYLDADDSEAALALLSQTDFSEGIEAGVPHDIPVAQKFGEVRMTDASGTLLGKQINTCGFVYFPEHPYLLCIMTKGLGNNIPALEANIASISRIIYKSMQGKYQ